MDEKLILWIFGTLIAGGYGVVIAAVKFAFEMNARLTKMETIQSLYSERVATVLHSPHTPELDALLEKFQQEYLRRHYELKYEEWKRLAELTEQIIDDKELSHGERQLAAWLNSVCAHKLGYEPRPYSPTP